MRVKTKLCLYRMKIWRQLNAFSPKPCGLGFYSFYGGGSVFVDSMFNVPPIVF